ncbi:MAG: 1-acyl-sn-glycerol-3-phosphate acyltransferase [Bacteroidetes bacterium]|nr:1-acyl-sn-glycerol-3-phosphate acyltransferase [Bacteroidota bacterium]MCW5895944.1 1-acyl-sn-glycerol-3-phosphate acyltransferase [Bacteroidota bacterium]
MHSALRSIWIWFATVSLIVMWLPLLAFIRVFDRDPVRYRTGRWFRRLGIAITKVNPAWRLHISGETITNPRRPYVVVSNHQSHADIPLLSHLPWEMKWLAKVELFKLPVVGWMLKLAGDIPVDRKDKRQGVAVLSTAGNYLKQNCSVMFFPEGTRSPDGRVHSFNEGGFRVAIKAGVPVLPLVIEGSRDCLPKHGWRFGKPGDIQLKVLPPVETTGLGVKDTSELTGQVRQMIIRQIAEWRKVSPAEVDAITERTRAEVAA